MLDSNHSYPRIQERLINTRLFVEVTFGTEAKRQKKFNYEVNKDSSFHHTRVDNVLINSFCALSRSHCVINF